MINQIHKAWSFVKDLLTMDMPTEEGITAKKLKELNEVDATLIETAMASVVPENSDV